MVTLKAGTGEGENGQSRLADQTQAQQFPRERAVEEVLIDSGRVSLAGTDYRAAVADLVARLSRAPSVAEINRRWRRAIRGRSPRTVVLRS